MGLSINIENLLRPYRESGREHENTKERSLDTMLNALINRYKISPEIAGSAIMKTMFELVNGKEFKGDGSYGSAGRELFLYIKSLSLKMMKKEVRINFDEAIVKPTTCTRMDCNYRTTKLKKLTRFQRFLKFMLKPRGIVRL